MEHSRSQLPIPAALQPLAERLHELLGCPASDRVLETMARPKRRAYWVNELLGGKPLPGSEPVAGAPGCWSLPASEAPRLTEEAQVTQGRLYPLNPASALAVLALEPQPGEELLDLAAAPGGKTLLMAAAMGNTGRIAAVEPVRPRFHRLRANMRRCGVRNVSFYLADGRGVGRKVPGRFDAVLLDAPCSSEARIRLNEPETFAHWKPRKIKEAARKQRGLLRAGFAALKVGGRLVYSTCSFAPEENEANVDYLLTREPGAELVPVELPAAPAMSGVGQWRGRRFHETVSRTARLLPDELWDGFFLAKVVKRG